MGSENVFILMGLYNGEKYLEAQLESFSNQSHSCWTLIVNDDGSTDSGVKTLRAFREQVPQDVVLGQGPRKGFSRNYLSMLMSLPKQASYVALSDQDDIWLPKKIERALEVVKEFSTEEPVLYCSRTWIYTGKIGENTLSWLPHRVLGFCNALVQNVAAGNTIFLNPAATELVREASIEAGDVAAHDWWIYQIISGAGGRIVFDPRPGLHYRQHSANQIGANRGLRARLIRLREILGGRLVLWNDQNIQALRLSAHRFTPENRARLEAFAKARKGGVIARLRSLRQSGIYRQSRAEGAAFWIAAAVGKI